MMRFIRKTVEIYGFAIPMVTYMIVDTIRFEIRLAKARRQLRSLRAA